MDAVNDPPKVVTPHHHVIKFGAFGIWSRYLTTQAGLSVTNGNLTVGILTDTNSGQVVLHGVRTENITFQVGNVVHGRNLRPLFALMPRLEHLCARYVVAGSMLASAKQLDGIVSQSYCERRTTNTAQTGTLSCPFENGVNFRGNSGPLRCPPRRFRKNAFTSSRRQLGKRFEVALFALKFYRKLWRD